MSARRLALTVPMVLVVLAGALFLWSVPALALVRHEYLSQLTGFQDPVAVTVDSHSEVFVVDAGAKTVDRFDAAGTPLPFSASESYVQGATLTGTPSGPFEDPDGVAVDDATGDVYVADATADVVDVFSSSGEYLSQLTGTPNGPLLKPAGLTIDQTTNDLYVADSYGGVVDVFGPLGEFVTEIGNKELFSGQGVRSVAVNEFTEDVYVADTNYALVQVFGGLGSAHLSTWSGVGSPGTQGFFGDLYGVGLDSVSGHVYVTTTDSGSPVIDEFADSSNEVFEGQLTGSPSGAFTEPQAVAVDPDDGDVFVADSSGVVDVFGPDIATLASIGSESFSSVSSHGAVVSAPVLAGGVPVKYYVEYGTTSAYGSRTAALSDLGAFSATVRLEGLLPDTEYHCRLVVVDETGASVGSDLVFTTLPSGEGLPDGRVYEMVTPPENANSEVEIPEVENVPGYGPGVVTTNPFQVAPDGSGITYSVLALTGAIDGGAGGNDNGDEYLAERSPTGGWAQTQIDPNGRQRSEYQGFSEDLSVGILESGNLGESEIVPPLTPDAPGENYRVLYEYSDRGNAYEPLFTNTVEPNRSPTEFGIGSGTHAVETGYGSSSPAFAGGSADFNDLLFEANDALLPGEGSLERELEQDVKAEITNGEDANYLYEKTGDGLSLVDVSPEGKVVPNATFGALPVGSHEVNPPDFSHVISANGDRVFWTDVSSGVVFMRVDGASTVQVSVGSARYWTGSTDGRYAFYTEGKGEHSELYRFDAEPENGHEPREALTSSDAGVLGVVGASEDGETVYFVAEGVLSDQNTNGVGPEEDQPNLYVVSHGGSPVFIATLSKEDGSEIPPFTSGNGGVLWGDWQPGFGQRTARVTGDGGSLVFMSNLSLAVVGFPHGYPNGGAEEVYVYNAGSNQLFCASCSPSGETPVGTSAAAFLPVNWHDTYLPQWISEDGDRVFFDSRVPLVTQDTNGAQDVYEWEREGHGSCVHGAGSTGGCVYLLSGGTSEADSWFVGASANGDDAFIVTRAKLVTEDENEAFDLYDARVDGGKPVTPPVCTGSGCQGVPSPPPVFATPPSVTFEGVGNFTATPEKIVKAKSKPLTRAQKLAQTIKACKREKQRKRRAFCETRARKLYSATARSGKPSSARRGRKHV